MSSAICKIVETELDLALGLIGTLKPQADMATKQLQSALLGVVSIGHGAIISLIMTIQDTIVNTCAVQCLAQSFEENKAGVCKLLRSCLPAKDFIFSKIGILLSMNPMVKSMAKSKGMTTSEYIAHLMFMEAEFERLICTLGIEDYIAMLTDWIVESLNEMVDKLEALIMDNARLELIDRNIRRILDTIEPALKFVQRQILAVQSFIDQCPLLCDLSENLEKKLKNYEDLKAKAEQISNSNECWSSAFNEANASMGWGQMHELYLECIDANYQSPMSKCGMPFQWLCSLDAFSKQKMSGLRNALNQLSAKNLESCMSAIGGEEQLKQEKESLFDVIFNDADRAEMGEKTSARTKSLVNKMSSANGSMLTPQTHMKLDCDKGKTKNKVDDVKKISEPTSVAPTDTHPKTPSGVPQQMIIKDENNSKVVDNAEQKTAESKPQVEYNRIKRHGRKSTARKGKK